MAVNFFSGMGELLDGIGVPIVLSLTASFVRILRFGWVSTKRQLSSVTSSLFVGQVVFWGLSYWDVDQTVKAALVSISAYMGHALLDTIILRLKHDIENGVLPKRKRDGSNENADE